MVWDGKVLDGMSTNGCSNGFKHGCKHVFTNLYKHGCKHTRQYALQNGFNLCVKIGLIISVKMDLMKGVNIALKMC